MQATLDAASLKPFTRALTCLSKYGEELTLQATPTSFSLSAVNSAKSAFCCFKFGREFFSKYRINSAGNTNGSSSDIEEVSAVTGQLLTKALLSILRHRTVEKAAERCDLSIAEAVDIAENDDETQDNLESKLVVKLHCKHGVVKTHRLLLLASTSLMTPVVPDRSLESRISVAPKALKDMIEHFALNKGAKSDPQLIWNFGLDEVTVRTMESSLENKGRAGLSTELVLSVEEFDFYEIQEAPITIAFHLRELNATIAFSESLGAVLDIRFTEPAAPFFIDVDGLLIEAQFVISTIQLPDSGVSSSQSTSAGNTRKRERDEALQNTSRFKKSTKVVQAAPVPAPSASKSNRSQSLAWTTPLPPSVPPPSIFGADRPVAQSTPRNMPPPPVPLALSRNVLPPAREEEPLFLPASSQMSQADVEVLRSTGLGIEEMNAQELADMLEGEGEEVAFDFPSQPIQPQWKYNIAPHEMQASPDGAEIEIVSTQSSSDSKYFHPLFED